MSPIPDPGPFDAQRVDDFLREFRESTRELSTAKRLHELDGRLGTARLSLADKIEVFKRLAPRADVTGPRQELRMECLLRSVAPEDLSQFKCALEYNSDYKDLVEYVFHDIDDTECRERILAHLRTAPTRRGVKVLSDVDDTMYANLVDERYPKKTLYPGVLEFYDALKHEPFTLPAIPVTTLSARPNPVAGKLEEASLKSLVGFTKGRLGPSALSGALGSSIVGTAETMLRGELDLLSDEIPHGREDEIGRVKFKNFGKFAEVYPEYRYVFVGDSGQADALTARLMVTEGSLEGSSRVVTTFIHDLRRSENDQRSTSPTFRSLPADLLVTKTSPTGRGVIAFRNYIEAALIAHTHSATLQNLVTAEGLARITRAALTQFHEIDFQGLGESRERLRRQYREDAEGAHTRLTTATPRPPRLEEDVTEIRRILDAPF